MNYLAQDEAPEDPDFLDDAVLDQFEIPFGEWADQSVDWIDNNLGWLLDAIEWPFNFLIDNLVNDLLVGDGNRWFWVVLGMFIVASLVRNLKVGFFSAVALAGCGLLGNDYWLETARTIGFIFVAVLLCVIIGIPIGIACGRIDGFWQVVRPVLDAMQVVHSFVYMLPFIFFFGIGEASATMVTMVFALPPLIRLTNLGIRQVPEDVVEASRAYGAPEWRVLSDVQLPLARPAIMTGLNQTLLLAISMLGIAAIMGAGGLGRLLFRALSNQDVALAASGGLAFFLVAVVLDRISQTSEGGDNLFHRIRLAWAHRRDPEVLIPSESTDSAPSEDGERFAEVSGSERIAMLVTGVGAAIAAFSLAFSWSNDAGYMSAYGRRSDEDRVGESFDGLSASGGSWFGLITLGLALFVIVAVIWAYRRPGVGPRWLTTDGVVIASVALLLTNVTHLFAARSELVVVHSRGIGMWIGLVGSLVAAVGAIRWIQTAPHSPLHPLSADIAWGRIIGLGIAGIVLVIAMLSGWSFDGREDVIVSPEIEAEIERLQQQARDEPENAGAIAAELSALMSTAQAEGAIVTDGKSGDGPKLGIWTLVMGILAIGTGMLSAGVLGRDEHRQWRWSAITAGVGAGTACVATGWIATHVRSADPNYVSGVGSFLAVAGGFFILASTTSVLKEFRRSKVYYDLETDRIAAEPATGEPAAEEISAAVR